MTKRRRSRTICVVLSHQTDGPKVFLTSRLSNSWLLTSSRCLQKQRQALKIIRVWTRQCRAGNRAFSPPRLQATVLQANNYRWLRKLLWRAQRYLWRTQKVNWPTFWATSRPCLDGWGQNERFLDCSCSFSTRALWSDTPNPGLAACGEYLHP